MERADKYHERDDAIKQLLRSPHRDKRIRGLEELDRHFRLLVMVGIPRSADCAKMITVLGAVLYDQVDEEIWGDTLHDVWMHVEDGTFREEGSLLAYLLMISSRLAMNRYRDASRCRRRQAGRWVPDEEIPWQPKPPSGLLDELELFFGRLRPEDQVALALDVRLAIQNGGTWVTAQKFTVQLNKIRLAKGWSQKTLEAVRSWRTRIRQKLRNL